MQKTILIFFGALMVNAMSGESPKLACLSNHNRTACAIYTLEKCTGAEHPDHFLSCIKNRLSRYPNICGSHLSDPELKKQKPNISKAREAFIAEKNAALKRIESIPGEIENLQKECTSIEEYIKKTSWPPTSELSNLERTLRNINHAIGDASGKESEAERQTLLSLKAQKESTETDIAYMRKKSQALNDQTEALERNKKAILSLQADQEYLPVLLNRLKLAIGILTPSDSQ